MSNTQTTDNVQTLEEKLAAVAAALQGGAQQVATDGGAANFVCPIDPAERALCDACQ